MRSAVLIASCACACATTSIPDASLPTGLDAWPEVNKLAFYPVQVRVAVDGAPITVDSLVAVQQSVQRDLEAAVNHENLETRAFFAFAEPWQLSAVTLGTWLDATPCLGAPAPANVQLASLLRPIRADAAVLVDVEATLTRDAVTSGHTLLGKLAGGLGVATLATVAALRAAASGNPYLEIAIEDPTVQLVARDLETHRFGPLCADWVDLGLRDDPTVRILGEASVTVAVIATDNRVLWFRRGKMPLVSADPKRAARLLATMVRAAE